MLAPEIQTLKLDDLLAHCTVRLRNESKGHRQTGAGFFVSPRHLVTCAHVVRGYARGQAIAIEWLQGGEDLATILRIEGGDNGAYPDLALLEIAQHVPDHEYVLLNADAALNSKVYAWGFPEGFPGGDSLTLRVEGRFNHGKLDDKSLIKLKDGNVVPGFSGSALLNLKTGYVCGVLKSTRDKFNALGGRAASASLILDLFNAELSNHQKSAAARKTAWAALRYLAPLRECPKELRTIAQVLDHWREWERARLLQVEASMPRQVRIVSPALRDEWQNFVDNESWRNQLNELLRAFFDKASELGIGFDEPVPGTEGAFEETSTRIRQWISPAMDQVRTRRRLKASAGDERAALQDLKDIRSALEDAINPRKATLGRCFLVYGARGAGKTEFVRNLSPGEKRLPRDRALLLPVEAEAFVGDAEAVILERAYQASGYRWTLSELDDFCNAMGMVFVVIVDDIQRLEEVQQGAIKRFTDFVVASAGAERMRFLLTIRDTNLYLVTPQAQAWRLHSFAGGATQQSGLRVMSGWVDLEFANEVRNLGRRILAEAGFSDTARTLAGESPAHGSPMLANILIALLRQFTDKQKWPVATLNFYALASRFWEVLVQANAWDKPKAVDMDKAIGYVTIAIIELKSVTPARTDVITRLERNPALAKRNRDILEDLSAASLIRFESGPAEDFGANSEGPLALQLSQRFLWDEKIAVELWLKSAPSGNTAPRRAPFVKAAPKPTTASKMAMDAAVAWLGAPGVRDSCEGIFEFLLLKADFEARRSREVRKQSRNLWGRAFEEKSNLPPRSPLFAARWTDKTTQDALANHLEKASQERLQSDRDIFALCYFALKAPDLEAYRRFELLQRFYADIARTAQTSFFLFAAEGVLESIKDTGELKRCLKWLGRSHLTGCSHELAQASMKALNRCDLRSAAGLVDWMTEKYLANESFNIQLEYHPDAPPREKDVYFFRVELLALVLDALWHRDRCAMSYEAMFALLTDAGWYYGEKIGLPKELARELRKECNLAFGRRVRRAGGIEFRNGEEIASYRAVIQNLQAGPPQRVFNTPEVAFYLLRHTVFPAGGPARIPRIFEQELAIARRTPPLAPLFKRKPMELQEIEARPVRIR